MPSNNPLEGVTLDQLDLSDKETRDYVSKFIDMSDPETALYFKSFEKTEVPLAGGEAPVITRTSKPLTTWERRLREAQGVRPGLDPENEFGGPRFFENGLPNPLSTVRDLADVVARGSEYVGAGVNTGLDLLDKASEQSGLADALSVDGNKFLPGSAIGALGEAFPLGGAEVGMINPAASAVRRLTPEQEAGYLSVAKTGTPEEILGYAKEQGFELDPVAVNKFVEDREKAGGMNPIVSYKELQGELPLEQQPKLPLDRTPEQVLEEKLQTEAKNFKSDAPVEDVPDFRQRELPLETPYHQQSFDFGEDAPKQKAINSRDTGETVPQEVMDAVDHINSITSDWQNAPSIEVFKDFAGLKDADPDAIGLTRPDGSVAVNMKNVIAEAADRGVEPNDILSAVTYHESLGHYGLTQRFGDGLDSFMEGLYNNSTSFKSSVDNWMKANPSEYVDDPNPIARASEEVLSIMSENGRIAPTTMNRLKNYVKGVGREMGLQLKYSDREIKTILGMAHDAVVDGKRTSASANGYKYMKRSTGRGSEGPVRGSFTDPEADPTIISKFRSQRPVEDILKEVAPEKTRETWDDWIDEAGKIKMTGKMAQNLIKGAEVPELKAAEAFLLEASNRVFDLSKKVSEGRATEREVYLLGAEMERAKNVAQSIHDVVSNSARILNSRKIEVASDRALSDGIRNMLRAIDSGALKDPEAIKAAASKLSKKGEQGKRVAKVMDILANALNLPRSLMSSFDLSAPLRQGIFLVGDKNLWKNVPSMFRQLGSDTAFKAVGAEIESRPTYNLMEKSGLAVTDLSKNLTKREEDFISQWAEKIPGVGRVVKASERAYTGFLNKVRADVFDDLVSQYKKAGIDLMHNDKALHDVASFVNKATGRGSLGRFDHAAPILSGLFFSPRLIASRVALLNPAYYVKLDPIVRRKALKSLASFGTIATTVLALAKMGGADVETDPRSSDFAKIRVNNTRYDVLGGFGQYLTLGSRLATNQKKNLKGEIVNLGEEYGSDTRLDVLLKFGINKESPVASFVTDYLRGSNAIGEPFETKKAVIERFIPLFLQDAHELIKEEGAAGVPMSVPGIFGIGMQTYDEQLGYDAFGRDIKELLKKGEPESDPIVLEVQRLNTDAETSIIPASPKSFKFEGVKHELSDEDQQDWQKVMGEYTRQYLEEDMQSLDYLQGSDYDKTEIIKKAHRDAYEDTKVYMTDKLGLTVGAE